MTKWVQVDMHCSRERVIRGLRIRPGTPAYEQARQALNSLEEILARHMRLACGYTVCHRPLHLGVEELDGAAWRVVCLCSCPEAVGKLPAEMLARGEYLEGYILGELINDYLFQASEELSRIAAEEMARRGCGLSRRYVPGEGTLALRSLETLLDAFGEESERGGVVLTRGYMLRPERSMLYVFGADPGYPRIVPEHDCGQCTRKDCLYRRTGTREEAVERKKIPASEG